jgi:hypothetical protein
LPDGELLPGERVLWSGRPAAVGFRVADAWQLAYPVIGLVIYGVLAAHSGSSPGALRAVSWVIWGLGGLTFIGYLIYVILLRRRFRRQDAYAVTTWRVIASPGIPGLRPRSAWLDQVAGVSVQGRGGGVAISGPVPPPQGLRVRGGQQVPFAGQPEFPQFHDLADAAVAHDVVLQARGGMRTGEAQAEIEPPRPGLITVPPPSSVTLVPGEELLWTGRPARVPAWFGWADAWTSGFGLVCIFMFGAVATMKGALAGPNVVFFTVFIAIGLYLALGRVVYRLLRLRRAVYVLTSRRLIAAWGGAVAASDLRDLLPALASGTSVICRPVAPIRTRGWNGWRLILAWPATTITPPVLAGLTDPVTVRDLVRQAQLAARRHGGARP